LARAWTEDRFAACIAGLVFIFNGVTLSSLMWPNYSVALGWMPWVLLFVERAWRQGDWRSLILASVLGTLQMLAGGPEIVLMRWVLLLGVGLALMWNRNAPTSDLLVRTGWIVLLTSGLMAVQLLPFFDLLVHSQRDRAATTLKWAMPPWGWGTLFNPMFR